MHISAENQKLDPIAKSIKTLLYIMKFISESVLQFMLQLLLVAMGVVLSKIKMGILKFLRQGMY